MVLWFVGVPMALAILILAIVALGRRKKAEGLWLLFVALIVAPVAFFCLPALSSGEADGVEEGWEKEAVKPRLAEQRADKPRPNGQRADEEQKALEPSSKPVAPRPLPTGPAAEVTRARAVARYPEIEQAGTPHHKAFIEAVEDAQRTRPGIFDDPDWALQLAMETARKLN